MSELGVYRASFDGEGNVVVGSFIGPMWHGAMDGGEWLTRVQGLSRYQGIKCKYVCSSDVDMDYGTERAEVYTYNSPWNHGAKRYVVLI